MNNSTIEQKIELIKDVKRFCTDELGIAKNGSFEKFSPNTNEIYCFFAAPKDGPILASRENYTAFFNQAELDEHILKFDSNKYDTRVRTVEAIANENIVITTSLLDASKSRLIYVVGHENLHIHLRFNNVKCDKSIEEPLCDYFGINSARQYQKKNNNSSSNIERLYNRYSFHQSLTNEIVNNYNISCPKTINPRTKLYRTIRLLEREMDTIILREDKSLNKAILQDMYVYSKNHFEVFEILKGISPETFVKYLSNPTQINTLSDLKNILK